MLLKTITLNLIVPLALSLFILLFSKTDNVPKPIKIILSAIPSIILLLFCASYVIFYFVGGGINEAIIYHLTVGFEGIDDWSEFTPLFILFAGIAVAIILSYWITYRYIFSFRYYFLSSIFLIFSIAGVIIHPFVLNIHEVIRSYYQKPTEQDIDNFNRFNADNKYNHPNITIKNKKNIIFLFVESLDQHYYNDQNIFPDLMPNLRNIANKHRSFTNIIQLSSTWSTIAGTTGAIQCGVPLIQRTDQEEKDIDRSIFLSNTYCLSDYLKQNGYRNVFITADNPKFTHTENFYQQHGFNDQDIYGKKDIKRLSDKKIELGSWGQGVYDKDILHFAKQQYTKLKATSEPFSLIISTLDTHRENGFLNPECLYTNSKESPQLLTTVKCTDDVLEDFYHFLELEKDNDTLLVIASDHIYPASNQFFDTIARNNRRNTFILVDFENPKSQINDRQASTLDIGITLLDYMGASIDQLNFGRSLLNPNHQTLVEVYQHNSDDQISRWRQLLSKFWINNNKQ